MRGIRQAATELVGHVSTGWRASDYFDPLAPHLAPQPAILSARSVADDSGIGEHPFFAVAAAEPDLLLLWTGQEAVVTGAFSQMLLLLASNIQNVHLRTLFLPVLMGEHQRLINGVARNSHPWLLYKLCGSVGLDIERVRPVPATIDFLNQVAETFDSTASALGALGVGSERLLLTEYTAIQECFRACLPGADYLPFLRANIEDDEMHSRIVEEVAAVLAVNGEADAYLRGSRVGVQARLRYYDDILALWRKDGLDPTWLRSSSS